MDEVADPNRFGSLPVLLERDIFMRTLIRELSGTLEDVVGLEESSGFFSVVGQRVGEAINEEYRAALGSSELSVDEVAQCWGLGLPMARCLIELHEARWRHAAGNGSEFIVSLPGLPPPDAESPLEATRAGPSVGEDRTPGRRVLIVDDNEDMAETLGLLVDHWGHDITMAHGGVEALEVAARYGPEVVLLDLGLPRLDGYEVARRMREDPELAGALLIAVSGYGRLEDQRRTKEAGFDYHLVKPVDHKVLKVLLES